MFCSANLLVALVLRAIRSIKHEDYLNANFKKPDEASEYDLEFGVFSTLGMSHLEDILGLPEPVTGVVGGQLVSQQ